MLIFNFPTKSNQAAIHLLAFNHFNIPYHMKITGKDNDEIIFEIRDDLLTPYFAYDIGKTVGLMVFAVDYMISENNWPINPINPLI